MEFSIKIYRTGELDVEPVDLIISQYAGFVGQATKKYLNTGGILLYNDSHGDATLSRFDNDFEFIGVIGKNNRIIDTKLDDYFVLPRSKNIDFQSCKTFSRPRVSNDNPYSEALFKTMKYRSKYPTKRFSNLKEAREWVKKFVHWYNNFRIHGSLDYLTPEEFFFIVVSKFSFIILSYPQL